MEFSHGEIIRNDPPGRKSQLAAYKKAGFIITKAFVDMGIECYRLELTPLDLKTPML